MSVVIPIPVAELEQQKEAPSLTYKLDLDKGRIIGMVDEQEAITQAIRKALITPRFKCLIYDNQYGSEIKDTILTRDVTPDYIEAELPRLVKDALLVDSRILAIYDFELQFEGDVVHIRFKVDSIYGTAVVEEVM